MASELGRILREKGIRLVKSEVGGGGSAVVHRGVIEEQWNGGPSAGTPVAIKQYRASILENPGQVDRIRQEATLGERLHHANVVRTYGLLAPEEGTGGEFLLLLEWVGGSTLDAWYAKQQQPPAWETLQAICLDLVSGVAELHNNGIFHRDIKPENVMIRGGRAVLMDIGVAEPTGNTEHSMHTSLKDFLGSTRYASPQFIMGESPFAASDDVYSLGATFFLLFTGKQIFAEVKRKPVIPIVAVQGPPRIDSLRENVPASMRVLLQACLSHDRSRRPTLEDLQNALQNPDGSKFISQELERQASDAKSYEILDIQDKGASFFADLAGDTPEIGGRHTVVRRRKSIFVPSYNREVVAEEWVAEAELKHVTSNLGYFVVVEMKWEETDPGLLGTWANLNPRGQWVEGEKRKLVVSAGDVVLRKSNRE